MGFFVLHYCCKCYSVPNPQLCMEKIDTKKKSMFFMSIYGCANTTTVNDKTALGPSVGEGL